MGGSRAPVAAAGWSIVVGAFAFAALQGLSNVLGLFDLRLEIEVLLIVAVGLAALAVNVSGQAPGVATRAVWTLSVATAAAAVGVGVVRGFETLSIEEQVAGIRQAASRDGKTVYEWKASFRGRDTDSRVFYLEERDLYRKLYGTRSAVPSGELRIYDVRDGHVTEAFRFQPDVGRTAVFQYRFLGDIDRDGDDELIGGYGRPQEHSQALLPFILAWDGAQGRYRLTSLQTEPPDRHVRVEPALNARPLRDGYRRRVSFRDESEGQSITGYRVQDFVATKDARLIGALAVDARTPTRVGEVELAVAQIRLTGEAPTALPCRLRTDRPLLAEWPSDRPLHAVLAERWQRERGFCQPIFS